MAFIVFNTENGLSPAGDITVVDVDSYTTPSFVSDSFTGTGSLGAHWLEYNSAEWETYNVPIDRVSD